MLDALVYALVAGVLMYVGIKFLSKGKSRQEAGIRVPPKSPSLVTAELYAELHRAAYPTVQSDERGDAADAVLGILRVHHERGEFRPVDQLHLRTYAGNKNDDLLSGFIDSAVEALNPEHLEAVKR